MIMVYFDKNINLWHQETYTSLDLCMFQSLAEPEPLRLCLHRHKGVFLQPAHEHMVGILQWDI